MRQSVRERLSKVIALSTFLYGLNGQLPSGANSSEAASSVRERRVVTQHAVRIDGRVINYRAIAGTLLLRNPKGEPSASVFYIAYVAGEAGSIDRRPITFVYNGGPGVSSTSLNIGAFGPEIVSDSYVDHSGTRERLIDNADSLLAATDLVFIDAVGTGFSRSVGSATGKEFYGVDEDGDAFARFIRRYTALNGRSASPKYLLGLSYGTMRSAVVADALERAGIRLSGIVLMSTVLNFSAISGGDGQDMQFSLEVPTEAAIASYYGKNAVPAASFDRRLPEIRAFSAGPYAAALNAGDALPEAERFRVARQLNAYIGMPVAEIMRADLRVSADRFANRLLYAERKTIGQYDARVSAPSDGARGSASVGDPSIVPEAARIAAAVPGFLRDTLRYDDDVTYVTSSPDVTDRWDWGESGPSGANATGNLAEAMSIDPEMRVLSLNGFYDLRTPFFGAEFQLAHLGVSAALHRNITIRYYRSGHMIFVDPTARAEMKRDLEQFYSFEPRRNTARRREL